MLGYAMRQARLAVSNEAPFIKRIKGLVSLEDSDDVDFRLTATFDEATLKSCKNPENRIPDSQKGFLVYGRQLTPETFRRVMGAFRTQVSTLLIISASRKGGSQGQQ